MRILFLDFDGVMHAAVGPASAMRKFVWRPLLEEILRPFPEVAIVLHASARDHIGIETIVSQLGPLGCRVIDIALKKLGRWEAICLWLESHPEVSDHIILDDEPREFPANCRQLIMCNPRTGISDLEIQRQLTAWLSNVSDKNPDIASSGRQSS